MVPSVQHLHGETVALRNPGDQDVIRSRLCRTQWPSRKVGRIGLVAGSMEKARFFRYSQHRDCICDAPDKRLAKGNGPVWAEQSTRGTIVGNTFFSQPCARLIYPGNRSQNGTDTGRIAAAGPTYQAHRAPYPSATSLVAKEAQKQPKAQLWTAPTSIQKDTKPKGFLLKVPANPLITAGHDRFIVSSSRLCCHGERRGFAGPCVDGPCVDPPARPAPADARRSSRKLLADFVDFARLLLRRHDLDHPPRHLFSLRHCIDRIVCPPVRNP